MTAHSPEPVPRPPHPLALALIERLRDRPGARVLEIGAGSGRNTRALVAAGLHVCTLPVDEPAAAALSTHALLHGTPAEIGGRLDALAAALESGAPLFGTFGSTRDARCGTGDEVAAYVYAPRDGDEAGVAHAYFDAPRLRALLAPHFVIESMAEVDVDEIAGQWAHPNDPLHNAVHWFVIARKAS